MRPCAARLWFYRRGRFGGELVSIGSENSDAHISGERFKLTSKLMQRYPTNRAKGFTPIHGVTIGLLMVALASGCSDDSQSDAGGTAGTSSVDSGGSGNSSGGRSSSGEPATVAGWLSTSGNHIVRSDGSLFRGRGANVQDTRSCWRCAWNEPDPDEVIRYIDTLVDDWNANFIRLALESYGNGSEEEAGGAVQYGTVVEDAGYLADIQAIVDHVGTKPGVVVLLSVWVDPSIDGMGWPTAQTHEVWRVLTQAFSDSPQVMFGLVNEPENNYDGSQDAAAWEAMNGTVAAIREQEDSLGSPHHVITVQGTGGWARFLDYYTRNPITAGGGENIAYEVHVYDPQSEFASMFVTPSATIPVVIGEFGPVEVSGATMSMDDCSALMDQAEQHDVPYLAWSFHMACPPNLLQDTAGGCSSGEALQPTPWGDLLRSRLAQPW